MSKPPVCVVVGVGPGNGAAFARRFAGDGYAVALLARSAESSSAIAGSLPGARAWQCDVGDAASVDRVFGEIDAALGEPEVVIYNAGSGVFGTLDEVSAARGASHIRERSGSVRSTVCPARIRTARR